MTSEELIENFALLDGWEDRYRYLIELGQGLPVMEETLKIDAHKVEGCTSQVWMVPVPAEVGIDFLADSDAAIVRGLIAVLRVVYVGKSPTEIQEIDIDDIFRQLGLDQHLSPNRRSGFFAMVQRLKELTQN